MHGSSRYEALQAMLDKGYEPGQFIIILCTPGDEQYTASFYGPSFSQVGIKCEV
jgi:hypothetical protein